MRRRALLSGLAGVMLSSPRGARADDIHVSSYGALMYGAPYTIGISKDYFRAAGADVTGVLAARGGGTTVRNILAGGLPYGEVSLAAAVAASQAGLDIRIVNTGVRTAADFAWVTMPDSPIHSINDSSAKKSRSPNPNPSAKCW